MIYDVEMRWVLRWWHGIIPHWKLQYRKQVGYQNSGIGDHHVGSPHSVALDWTPWKDVNEMKDD